MLHYVKVFGIGDASSVEVAKRVRDFLCIRGFRETPRLRSRSLKFSRGTSVATFFAFDPSRWRIDINVDPELRTVQMFVHTDGQVVTPREKHYFDVFFDELLSVLAPERLSSATALQIHESGALSHRAAQAALNENVSVTFGFLLLLPAAILLFHLAMAVPMFWSIIWGFGASVAVAYAWLFSIKNRPRMKTGFDALPTPACRPFEPRQLA